jgi:lipoyl(octanoyl) transferase
LISVLNLGRCDYGTALRLQQTLVDLRKQERIPNTLLFVEHPPVITLGRNAKEHNIIAPPALLKQKGVETFEINRGGDVTFHGPGQLVAYPIFDLRSFEPKLGAVDYVRKLEEVLMRVAAQYGIETQRIKGMTGVWTFATPPPRLGKREKNRDYVYEEAPSEGAATSTSVILSEGASAPESKDPYTQRDSWPERKIAAIGVHISRGVTSHGFALNVTTDLSFFQLIVPCGLTKPVTSIDSETALRPTLDEVIVHASRNFSEVFRAQVLWLDSLDDLLPSDVPVPNPDDPPQDTPATAPEKLRQLVGDDTHLA